mmetsp:Transcript_1268/g.2026  ORF Transcript_1268/g.2026 Transcript_1268/m.2026 type:complete len:87 (-) Transcript_1268:96-356(-)
MPLSRVVGLPDEAYSIWVIGPEISKSKRALGGWFEEEAAIRPATRKRRVERMHEMFLLHLDLDEESTAGDAAGTAILPVAVGWHAR